MCHSENLSLNDTRILNRKHSLSITNYSNFAHPNIWWAIAINGHIICFQDFATNKLFEVIPFAYIPSNISDWAFTKNIKYKRTERFDFNGWPTYRRILLTQTSDKSWIVLEPAKNLSSDFVEWSSEVLITSTQTKPECSFFNPGQILWWKRCNVGQVELQTGHQTKLFLRKKARHQEFV